MGSFLKPITDTFDKILAYFGIGEGAGIFLAIALVCVLGMHLYHLSILKEIEDDTADELSEERDRSDWLISVGERRYRGILKWMLRKLDNWLGSSPWNERAYVWCLSLTVIYPITSVFLIWTITGENTSGITDLFDNSVTTVLRSLFVITLVTALAFTFTAFWITNWLSYLLIVLAGISFVVCIVISVIANTNVFVSVLFIAGAGAVLGYFAGASAASGAIICAVMATALYSSDVRSLNSEATLTGLFLDFLFFTTPSIGILMFYVGGTQLRNRLPFNWSIVEGFILAIAIALTTLLVGSTKFDEFSVSLLIFLAVLPLLNAFFDWLSLGVTRLRLRRTLDGGVALVNGIIDLVYAVVIVTLLAVSLVAVAQILNELTRLMGASYPLINIVNILHNLRNRPSDPAVWWVYAILFSTLLPTFVHGMIAVCGIVALPIIPSFLIEKLRNNLKTSFKGKTRQRNQTAAIMTFLRLALFTFSIASVIGLIALLWAYNILLPQFAALLLYFAELTAALLGAHVAPVPPELLRNI